ncbi:prostacyclin receptor isoform X1 [Tachysurus ichikawai]
MVMEQIRLMDLNIFGFVNAISPVGNDQQNLLAFRFSALNPVVDPWVFIIFRKSIFRHVLSLLQCCFSKAAVKNTAPEGLTPRLQSNVPAESTALQSKIYCSMPQ